MGKGANSADEETPAGLLAKIRPRRRSIFFVIFVAFCAWLFVFADACQVEVKSRRDCGFAGISPGYCVSGSCFTSRGGKMDKMVVKVERGQGETLGLEVKQDKGKDSMGLVHSIGSGAVQAYNSKLPSDSSERIRVGDVVAKVDGTKSIKDALAKTTEKTIEIELRRSQLPSYLQWLRTSAKPGPVETVLTAPGFKRWSKLTSQIGTVGLGCWLLSGYGAASLPGYYFGLSGLVAFKMVRCCHDEKVPGGTPHCYLPAADEPQAIVQKAWKSSVEFGNKAMKQWRSFADEAKAAWEGSSKKKEKNKKKD
eukprot:TRINITY_DN54539_c0_g1_i1.p1 TRINITY_DN54539_c0_g1~~TRINITY_DN54539_c0_g1_i1.p1  ORF type:complete len:337 (+),score=80.34 TRINITY_DN54539_c0_g1_i1:86-1012(+)